MQEEIAEMKRLRNYNVFLAGLVKKIIPLDFVFSEILAYFILQKIHQNFSRLQERIQDL